MLPRDQPLLGRRDDLAAQLSQRNVDARQIARAARQRGERVLIADVAQIDVELGLEGGEQLAQLRYGETVAR